jgi:hypothetical protein
MIPASGTEGPTAVTFERRTPPVKVWALVGLAFLLFEAYLMIAWVASGDAKPSPRGPTPISATYQTVIHVWEIANVVIALLFLYHFLVKPWRRERRVTLDGLLCVVFFLLFWQDPLSDYIQTAVTYSAAQTNFGSWVMHIPGWNAPLGDQLGWPIVWGPAAYLYFWLSAVIAGGWVMTKARQRWPRLTRLQVIVICYFTMAAVDLLGELTWVWLGLYTFIGPPWPSLTLFYGHYYQFPIYETLLFSFPMTAFTCLRYFRNDRGETLAEHGLHEVHGSGLKLTAIRFLALLGVTNVLLLALYNIPINWFGMRTTAPVQDIVDRSYLLNGICGPGTTYACPGKDIPMPRPESAHVDPQGQLVGLGR